MTFSSSPLIPITLFLYLNIHTLAFGDVLAIWDQLSQQIRDRSPPPAETVAADAKAIEAFERCFHVTLPDDMRRFLWQGRNGGLVKVDSYQNLEPYFSLLPIQEWGTFLADFDQSYLGYLWHEGLHLDDHSLGFSPEELIQDHPSWQEKGVPLVTIGLGDVDYDDRVVWNTRNGKLYLFRHTIPSWSEIGTFSQWMLDSWQRLQNNPSLWDTIATNGPIPQLNIWLPLAKACSL